MRTKPKRPIRVIRNDEEIDPNSTKIPTSKANKLRKILPPIIRLPNPNDPLKLVSKEPEPVYTSGKSYLCRGGCGKTSPTKRMYVYRNTNRGKVYICENCVDEVEKTSFTNLDALDEIRKKYKVE